MRAWFVLFDFQLGRIYFEVHLVVPSKLAIVFSFIQSIILDIFQILSLARKHSMLLFPAVFVLRDARAHVHTLNSSDIASYIKISVNKTFSLATALNIPYIQLNNSHI